MVVLVIRAEEEDATRKENLRLRPYKRQQQRSEKMRFYHAAPKETMMKIYAEGVLKKSWGTPLIVGGLILYDTIQEKNPELCGFTAEEFDKEENK